MAIKLFFETLRSKELESKVNGLNIIRLRCSVQIEKIGGEPSVHDAIVDTGAFISLIPFSIWKDAEVERIAEHSVKGIISKPECSIPILIGRIKLRLIDEENQTREINSYAYLALTDEIPLLLGFKYLLSEFKLYFDYPDDAYIDDKIGK